MAYPDNVQQLKKFLITFVSEECPAYWEDDVSQRLQKQLSTSDADGWSQQRQHMHAWFDTLTDFECRMRDTLAVWQDVAVTQAILETVRG